MCGRYTLTTRKHDLAKELDLDSEIVLDLEPRYNIAPTQEVPILIKEVGVRMALFRWGLIPPWAKDATVGSRMINARRETLAERASFREPFQSQRCLVIADGFYEWHASVAGKPKIPHYVRLKSRKPFTFAGLWSKWRGPSGQDVYTCTIVTRDANEIVGRIHDRMPVIVSPANRDAWLDPEHQDPESLAALLGAHDPEEMEMYPVSRHVNSPDHEGAQCIEEMKSEDQAADAPAGEADGPPEVSDLGPLFRRSETD
jgi:putative SOS response-associated peptidase YedK